MTEPSPSGPICPPRRTSIAACCSPSSTAWNWRWPVTTGPSRSNPISRRRMSIARWRRYWRGEFSQPLWSGQQSLAGKAILIYSEQGLGDTLQFCRYVKPLAELGARVILEVQKPLATLLSGLGGACPLGARGGILPPFDYQCPLLSLPLAFK